MDETAQIILATGIALGIILFALKGNLAVILARGERKASAAVDRSVLRERWLLVIVCGSALSGLFNLLARLM